MLDEWTSRLLWQDPNDNELALRFHYDTLFINNIQTIKSDGWELAPPDWAGFSVGTPRTIRATTAASLTVRA